MNRNFPPEVLEIIFSYLPLPDLLLRASRVSREWSRIIRSEYFIPAKKDYFKLLHEPSSGNLMAEFLVKVKLKWNADESKGFESFEDGIIEASLPVVLDDIQKFYPDEISRMFQDLRRAQALFKRAQLALQSRMPRYSKNFACVAFVMCLFAQELSDVTDMLDTLMTSKALCNYTKVSEMFYRFAMQLLLLERTMKTPKRIRYLVSHALQLSESMDIETNIETNIETKLSAEQRRVVNHKIDKNSVQTVRVIAFAGTGKTTTLKNLCLKNSEMKFLLLVFNKSVQEHAEKTFPANVICRTANSLALDYLRAVLKYPEWKISLQYELKPFILMSHGVIRARGKGSGNIWQRCAQVLHTIKEFCKSRDPEITKNHVPQFWMNRREKVKVSGEQQSLIYEDANFLWDEFIMNPRKSLKIDHTIIMKLCQLAEPDLRRLPGLSFDVLLLDESQDLNPAMLDIAIHQKCCKFVVGDPHQQIYSFNGAINGLKNLDKFADIEQTYYLTQSFRFGPEIAFAATMVIQGLLDEKVNAVTCTGKKKDKITGCSAVDGKELKTVYLGRTNAGVFEELVTRICGVEVEKRPIFALPDNMDKYYESVRNIAYFYLKNRDETTLAKHYDNFEAYEEKMLVTNDMENIRKIAIVKKYDFNVIQYIRTILDLAKKMDDPSVEAIFSTVHKFKGLECPRVFLLNDFYFGSLPHSPAIRSGSDGNDEINLLYVALTRAQKEVVMNDSLYFILFGLAKENFEEISDLADEDPSFCINCTKEIDRSDGTVVMRQNRVVLSQDIELVPGELCEHCATSSHFDVDDIMADKIEDPRPTQNTKGLLLKTLLMGETDRRTVERRTRHARRSCHFSAPQMFPEGDGFDDLLRGLNEQYS